MSGSLELMKEQVLATLTRIGKCKGGPIQSGVSSGLAIELLPASPGRLTKMHNRCIEWSRMSNALEQV